jgi:hypothetical protein
MVLLLVVKRNMVGGRSRSAGNYENIKSM